MSAVMPQWQFSLRVFRLLVCSGENAARTRLRPCHPRRNRRKLLQDICSLCPFDEIVARRTQRMAAIERGVTGTADCFVRNVLQFDRPLFKEIDGVTDRGDFHDREASILYENRAVEKLVVHLILSLFSLSRYVNRASQKYEFGAPLLQGVTFSCAALTPTAGRSGSIHSPCLDLGEWRYQKARCREEVAAGSIFEYGAGGGAPHPASASHLGGVDGR